MKPLRVLHVIPSVSLSEGGPSVAVELMERGLAGAGVSVVTLTTDHHMDRQLQRSADNRRPTALGAGTRVYCRTFLAPYKVAPGMMPWLMANVSTFDVVHIHGLFSFAPTVAAWAARLRGVPYVIRPLGTLGRYGMTMRRRRAKQLSSALIERASLSNAAAVHFTARSEMNEAREQGFAFRGVVIPIGVEKERDRAEEDLRHRFPQLGERMIVLYLSRIDAKKNLESLIDALAISETLRSNAALLVAGSGDPAYVDALKERASATGAEIIWLGQVEGAAKAAALRTANVFVLPSFSENFGIAVVEAMLSGLPVIVGRGVAIADEVGRARAGIVVTPDPAALAEALEELMLAPGTRSRMAKNARTLAEGRFSLGAMTSSLIELYGEVRRPAAVATLAQDCP